MAEISSYIGQTGTALLGGRRRNRQHTSGQRAESDNNTAAAVSRPAKKAKLDPRAAASLKFSANSSAPPRRISEFDQYQYLAQLPVDNSVDVLQYWHDHEATYPNVASVARNYLCAPATSTSSERQFFFATDVYVITTR